MRSLRSWPMLLSAVMAIVTAGGAVAESLHFDLTLKNGQLPEGQRLVRVWQGDQVTLKWTTDQPFTLHVHGYDLEARLGPQAAVELHFTAGATGRFPLEIHGAGTERTVGYLEVHPR